MSEPWLVDQKRLVTGGPVPGVQREGQATDEFWEQPFDPADPRVTLADPHSLKETLDDGHSAEQFHDALQLLDRPELVATQRLAERGPDGRDPLGPGLELELALDTPNGQVRGVGVDVVEGAPRLVLRAAGVLVTDLAVAVLLVRLPRDTTGSRVTPCCTRRTGSGAPSSSESTAGSSGGDTGSPTSLLSMIVLLRDL